jgi:drug/metabolite transporter superfamily protein YnfA
MAAVVYILCAITSVLCAWLLWRGYRRSRARVMLGLNNVLLVIDKVVFPDPAVVDLSLWRSLPAVAGILLLLYGLVWEE